MDVGGWLRNLGLGKYEQVFVANAIDSDVLAELKEGDFEKLGIPLGDRIRLIKAINALGVGSAGAAVGREAAIGRDIGSAQEAQPAERRHLTVMICDLVGSTALLARLERFAGAGCGAP